MKKIYLATVLYFLCNSLSAQVIVYFDFDKHTLNANEVEKLNGIAFEKIKSITAYTDSVGSTKYNIKLANRRLATVQQLLKELNEKAATIPSTVKQSALGESTTEATDALNRRVTIELEQDAPQLAEEKPIVENNKPTEARATANTDSVKVVRKIALPTIYFYGSSYTFRPESREALLATIEEAKKVTNEKIEIRGHINHPSHYAPIENWEEELSWQRAKAVYDFLKENGVDVKNFTYRGMSNKEMVKPHATTLDDMQKNMRVEFAVIE